MFAEEKKPLWYNVRPYRQTAAEQLAYYVVFHADLDTELEWCQTKMYLFHYRQIKTHKKSKVWRSYFKSLFNPCTSHIIFQRVYRGFKT